MLECDCFKCVSTITVGIALAGSSSLAWSRRAGGRSTANTVFFLFLILIYICLILRATKVCYVAGQRSRAWTNRKENNDEVRECHAKRNGDSKREKYKRHWEWRSPKNTNSVIVYIIKAKMLILSLFNRPHFIANP